MGTRFAIGDNYTVLVPIGADQLQLGVNDDIFSDNTGSWNISVAGPSAIPVSPTPEPANLLLFGAGLLGLAMIMPRRVKASA